ncbi:sugar ABC transporter ATP-binding protein [Geosporobacter ferrireducens]|uniref:Autoinducer 2 import ATP-binding protein LsrA n=1 Tax=Geosporobacter ferrireducens TaxID=1424294 RepID=A0A1D8GKZ9_9FIRM|nr:sugar ABC transporter ATP-binding protein [Geosporobacter ferrireducens]AOT71570.1 ABC transporter ATP-binding protein [Geosporobacter ferrireducens]MTI57883.1 sugar ABC transporter ATP-binding protein [Geosporobacter ferrireducens]
MNDPLSEDKSLVCLSGIVKSFSNNLVLRGISLELYHGEIIALIGGNGAGKSTLMKILMGIYTPDSGEIYINGEKTVFSSPSVALQKGIYLVPQEPMLFPNMTVEENILIGFNENRAELKQKLMTLMRKLSWNIALDRTAETLSIAEQQLIEILRGLLREAKILILDEPTSALSFSEIESLFKVILDLKSQGIGMFYITHRLTEVFEIATRIVILRDGTIALSGDVSEFTKEMLIQGLLPPNVENEACRLKKADASKVDYSSLTPILAVEDLTGYGFRDVSLSVYPNEILGIAGVVGAGRTELAEAVFGIGEIIDGKVYLNGEDITGLKTSTIIRKGLNYVPEDRHLNGIFSMTNVMSNLTSSVLKWLVSIFINIKQEMEITEKYIKEFRIKVADQSQSLKLLSGGNQQKVVIGKALATQPKVIILDEPTRGIDAGARADVYKIIYQLKEQGHAILLISSDLEEIVELCDRAEIMYRGTISHRYERDEITLDRLMAASFGVCSKEGCESESVAR